MIRTLAMTAILILLPATLPADPPIDIRQTLQDAIDAYEDGDREEALRAIRVAQKAILEETTNIPGGVMDNLAELDHALGAYTYYVYGDRPDLDATHDAVRRVIAELRIAYGERYRTFPRHSMRVDFDMDGRIRKLGAMDIDYVPFSDRIRSIGEIDIDYVPFSTHPREIGDIDYNWVFGELWSVAGVDVDRDR